MGTLFPSKNQDNPQLKTEKNISKKQKNGPKSRQRLCSLHRFKMGKWLLRCSLQCRSISSSSDKRSCFDPWKGRSVNKLDSSTLVKSRKCFQTKHKRSMGQWKSSK